MKINKQQLCDQNLKLIPGFMKNKKNNKYNKDNCN